MDLKERSQRRRQMWDGARCQPQSRVRMEERERARLQAGPDLAAWGAGELGGDEGRS